MISKQKQSVISLGLLSLAVSISGCKKTEAEPQPVVNVQVAKVEAKSLTQTISADAVLFPIRQAAIVSKLAAPIKKLYVQRGDRVHAGQLLATLENADIAASVVENRGGYEQAQAAHVTATEQGIPEETQKAQLDLQQAKENLDAQTKLVESRQSLFEQGALPRKDLDAARVSFTQAKAQYEITDRHLQSLLAVGHTASVKSANAQLAQAKGKFEGAEAQLSFTEIHSPIDGFVTERPNYSGEMPPAGSSSITVMDTSSIIAKAHISQVQAMQLKVNDPAEIVVTGAEATSGKVTLISPALDPNSTTVEIWVTAPNKTQQLRPGSAAKVEIKTKQVQQALAVPLNAVVVADGKSTVLVVEGDAAHAREIQTGITDSAAGLVQVVSGLKAGDVVVTNQAYGLPDKTKVKVEAAETPGQQPAKEKD
ncbi:MAG: secretion protein HlyD [Acidobacteriales bacterium]|nr:secretion protein HlyD [Terriglobales bacterium]